VRILIVSTFFPPLNSIASLRPHSWAKYWTEAGHDVTVLTITKQQDLKAALSLANNGFEVIEVDPPKFVNFLKRVYQTTPAFNNTASKAPGSLVCKLKNALIKTFNYLRYNKGIFNSCRMPDFTDLWIRPALKTIRKKGTWDLVVSTAGPYSVHIVAEKLKKSKMARQWIADYRDPWTDNYAYHGLFPFNFIEEVLERKLLRSADAISTASLPFADILGTKYGRSKVHSIENGFDPIDLETLDPRPIFPEDGKYRIVHTGSIYDGRRDPTPLFQAIASLSRDPTAEKMLESLEVLFVGLHQANLQKLIASHQINKWVKFQGFVSREDALRMQRDAHMLLFLKWNDPNVDGVLTGKIYEYLFSGTSILVIGGGGLEASSKLVLDIKAGIVLTQPERIADFLRQELMDVHKKKSSIDPGVLARYNRKTLAMNLLNIIK
jgi:glycosyltransferase involved in cell wall biosynthesis